LLRWRIGSWSEYIITKASRDEQCRVIPTDIQFSIGGLNESYTFDS
jgi:hypothetical protein